MKKIRRPYLIVILIISLLITFSCQTNTSLIDQESPDWNEQQVEETETPSKTAALTATEEIIIETQTPTERNTEPPLIEPEIPEQTEEEPSNIYTIQIWIAENDDMVPALQNIVDGFEWVEPNYDFTLTVLPQSDIFQMYQAAVLTNQEPDLLIASNNFRSELLSEKLISPEVPDTGGFLPIADQMCSVDGTRIGLPFSISGVVMYRNPEIIPEQPASFSELVLSAQQARKNESKGAMLETGVIYSLGHFFSLGGSLMDQEGFPLFNDDYGLAWLEMIQQFIELGAGYPNTDDDLSSFLNNETGIIIDGTWNLGKVQNEIKTAVIDPWPAEMSGFISGECIYFKHYYTFYPNSWSINGTADFLISKFWHQEIMENSNNYISPLVDVTFPDELRAQAQAALAGGVLFPDSLAMSPYWGPVTDAIDEVYEGVNLEEILQKMYENVYSGVDDIQ